MQRNLLATAAAVILIGAASSASAGVIGFEGFTHGDNLSAFGSFSVGAGINVTVSDDASEDVFVFNTQGGFSSDDDDLQGFFDEAGSGSATNVNLGNIVVLGTASGVCPSNACDVNDTNTNGTMIFTFDVPVNFVSFKAVDTGDSGGITIEYLDGLNSIAGPSIVGAAPGDNEFEIVSFGGVGANISQFTFTGSGGIDDLEFTRVPVPATLGLLGAGLIGMGLLARRRKAA